MGAADPTLIWSIGNLALVEAAINHSLGNKPYSAADDKYTNMRPLKAAVYPQSQYLLTRALAKKVEIGKNSRIDRAVSSFVPFQQWNAEAIRNRAALLAELATKVWDVQSPLTVDALRSATSPAIR